MKFDVFTQLEYAVQSQGTLIFNVQALRTANQCIENEELIVEPYTGIEELQSAEGENRLLRFEATQPGDIKISYTARVNNYFELTDYSELKPTMVSQFPSSVLPYLNPSRYCQSDKLYRLANNMFGHIDNPFAQVLTLTNWIYTNVQYLSGSTNTETSAFDTVTEQAGVCRDFAHLGIALCRALTIPARYFSCYAFQLEPPDFHACFEAYLGGKWVLFDATRLVPLNGLIKIATGHDAGDTAIANIFGDIFFSAMQVSCQLAEDDFTPFYYTNDGFTGLSYF